ncbi:acyl-CoA synthetase [Paraconexibacter antarcticus]|uniref:Acyl-CoA synthetase n=1 Tax=Paraconexibacter antarcticus TaxID=2949664 RepID=A0ABY5DQR8_9ACTN|nr:acyl-CoA synthetase [Paraconexibacter antarcticus]UTI63102.1 acyl-CoA synthetase [Paraconexibacter antarcticus]
MNVIDQLANKVHLVRTLHAAGVVRPTRPDRLVQAGLALHRFGPTPAAGYAASAARFPDAPAIIDELGTLTFREVHERTNALAHELAAAGIREGDAIAILARNHRGFIDAVVACSKLGCHALFLNTMFAGPQITDVCEREQPAAIIYDEEFTGLVADALTGRKGFVAWSSGEHPATDPVLEDLIARGRPDDVTPPSEKGRVVILTSGTTGTPKGANRKQPESLEPAAALFSKIPLKARETTHIAAPMFHSWGFAHLTLGMGLSSTLVLRRRFDPESMLQAVAHHRCTALAVVPVMLQRTLELPPACIARHDTSCLRVIAASGSALPGELATRVMDRFGDVLYNLYGSTEVAWATIAQPADMRAAPGTAGTPPRGTIVRLYDDDGHEVPAGQTGRIFVGNEMMFDGYTGGGDKERIDGLMSTGDVGHLDAAGRLFVDGRDDDMIVSGGENVFPREVEDLLADHAAVEEASVLGVEDPEFGQRLKAFVVVRDGQETSEPELKAYIRSHLASYKVPREVVFLDELPRNATGKVLKRELKAV